VVKDILVYYILIHHGRAAPQQHTMGRLYHRQVYLRNKIGFDRIIANYDKVYLQNRHFDEVYSFSLFEVAMNLDIDQIPFKIY
jgi:hypothetical protein